MAGLQRLLGLDEAPALRVRRRARCPADGGEAIEHAMPEDRAARRGELAQQGRDRQQPARAALAPENRAAEQAAEPRVRPDGHHDLAPLRIAEDQPPVCEARRLEATFAERRVQEGVEGEPVVEVILCAGHPAAVHCREARGRR